VIEIWHGNCQRVGHLGDAQDDYNLMGRVHGKVASLSCRVNGGPPRALSIGSREDGFGDGRRLAGSGHFNADIPIATLRHGSNQVTLACTDSQGREVVAEVTLNREEGGYRLPARIVWTEVDDPQSVGQYVDGEWDVDDFGLRTQHTGYDRIFLMGERTWQDYEVLVPVKINRIEPETGPRSGGNGLGVLMRFCGHVTGGPREFPLGQPKWGYQPFGAICWLRWMGGAAEPPQRQFYRGDSDGMFDHGTYTASEGSTHWMRARCQTLADTPGGEGVTRYSFRVWPEGSSEPGSWVFEETQTSTHALRQGGVVLLAHHVDATFGNVSIKEAV